MTDLSTYQQVEYIKANVSDLNDLEKIKIAEMLYAYGVPDDKIFEKSTGLYVSFDIMSAALISVIYKFVQNAIKDKSDKIKQLCDVES